MPKIMRIFLHKLFSLKSINLGAHFLLLTLQFKKQIVTKIMLPNDDFSKSIYLRWPTKYKKVKKVFCYEKLFWSFTIWMNCSSDLQNFANSWPSASNFKIFSQSLEQFFLTVGQNNFGNKIPFLFITMLVLAQICML